MLPLTHIHAARTSVAAGLPLLPARHVHTARLPASKGVIMLAHTHASAVRLSLAVLVPTTTANGSGGARCVIRVLRWAFGPLGPIDAATNLCRHFSVVQVKNFRK